MQGSSVVERRTHNPEAEGSIPSPATEESDLSQFSDEQAEAILQLAGQDPEVWFQTCATIRDHEGLEQEAPKPNIVQRRMFAYYRKCQLAGQPCKMIILKPRQVGASTGTQALMYHHQRRYGSINASVMGDVDGTSDKIFEIYRLFARSDRYPWPDGKRLADKDSRSDYIKLPGGSEYRKETAGSSNAGRGGTVQAVNLTEAAHYAIQQGKDPVLGYLNSFYDKGPRALGIVDSTPNGPKGWFYNRIMAALKGDGKWHLIFAAWFEFPEHTLPFESQRDRDAFEASLDEDERSEQRRFKVSLEQLYWRRETIQDKCDGDPDKFRQEYPSDIKEAFLLSARKRFNISVLAKWRTRAANFSPTRGDFQLQDGGASAIFVRDPSGLSYQLEEPKFGCRYLVAWDTCTGQDQQSISHKADPDWHSIGVMRDGYYDVISQKWRYPRLVALYHSQEEISVAARVAYAKSVVYGGCMIVPEVNNSGYAGVERLLDYHARIFQRARRDPRTQTEAMQYGWYTDPAMRRTIIDHLAGLVREDQIDIQFFEVIEEMENFVRDKKGVPRAMEGFKDDHVLMVAIAAYNLPSATEMKLPKRKNYTHRQLRKNPTLMCPDGWSRAPR